MSSTGMAPSNSMIRSLAPAAGTYRHRSPVAARLGAAAASRAAAGVLAQHGVHLVEGEAEFFKRGGHTAAAATAPSGSA
jgi:hypothetical protein